jgi:hypothetical protein
VLDFRVKLAEVPIGIRCRYDINRRFLKDYLTDEKPLFCVEPTDEDLERARADYDALDRMEDRTGFYRSEDFFENAALNRLIAERITEYDVLLMHGPPLSLDGETYIFTAPSGTGKSTHARLWRERFGDRVVMINDDKPMLRIRADGVSAYGTPWNGKHSLSCNTSAPVRAIARLKRSGENRIEPMAKSDAFAVLVSQALSSKDPAVMMRILTLEKRLLDQVRFYTLYCNMDPDAVRVSYEGMKQV